jgi:hypothetical protein
LLKLGDSLNQLYEPLNRLRGIVRSAAAYRSCS